MLAALHRLQTFVSEHKDIAMSYYKIPPPPRWPQATKYLGYELKKEDIIVYLPGWPMVMVHPHDGNERRMHPTIHTIYINAILRSEQPQMVVLYLRVVTAAASKAYGEIFWEKMPLTPAWTKNLVKLALLLGATPTDPTYVSVVGGAEEMESAVGSSTSSSAVQLTPAEEKEIPKRCPHSFKGIGMMECDVHGTNQDYCMKCLICWQCTKVKEPIYAGDGVGYGDEGDQCRSERWDGGGGVW